MLCRPSYSLWRHSLKACGSLGKRLASGSIPGFASTDGTMAFVHQAELPMYHVFEKHKLYVNPIIHGPPKKVSGKNIRSDEALEEAVLKNRSNAVYVYRYSPKTDKGPSTWHSPMLNKLITGNGLPRECIVTIADLGIVDSLSEISRRLKEALSLTNLEHIDCVVVQCTGAMLEEDSKDRNFNTCVTFLEKLCKERIIQFYGFYVNVAPSSFHTPPRRVADLHGSIPTMLEEDLRHGIKYPHADLILYKISPTHAQPATYPMLEADDEYLDAEMKEYVKKFDEDEKRSYTRASIDPLLCYHGVGREGTNSQTEQSDMDIVSMKTLLKHKEKQMNAYRDRVSSKSGEEAKEMEEELAELDAQEPTDIKELKQLLKTMEDRDDAEDDELKTSPIPLISSVLPQEFCQDLGEALDSLCPQLKSTPLLEQKALRVVYSAGVDVMVLDSDSSVAVGRPLLTPKHMLSSSATTDIFGNFMVPFISAEDEPGSDEIDKVSDYIERR